MDRTDLIIGNMFSLFAMLSDSFSGTRKKHSQIMLVQIVSQFFYGASSIVFKAYSSTAQNVVAVFRNLAAMKNIKSKVLEWVLILAGVVLGIIFNNRGLLGWLPIIANLEYSVAVFKLKNNEKALKEAFIVNSVLFAVFNAVIMNYVGAVSSVVIAVTTAVSLIRTSDGSEQYSEAFIRFHGIRVKVHNLLQKWKRNIKLFVFGRSTGSEADDEAYSRFAELIPTLGSYGKPGAMKQLRIHAIEKGHKDLGAYLAAAQADPAELSELKENLTFVGTHFFRGEVWGRLKSVCEDSFRGRDAVRVWCAGCSSGKEAYSILMVLLDVLPPEKIVMLATDYNSEMLRLCREGAYPLRTIDEIPAEYRRYVEKYVPDDSAELDVPYRYQIRFCDDLRGMMRTQRLDLLTDDYPGGFDLILCRNVIKFFEEDVRRGVQRRLAEALAPGGFLVVSDELSTEGIQDPGQLYLTRIEGSCIYRKDAASGTAGAGTDCSDG